MSSITKSIMLILTLWSVGGGNADLACLALNFQDVKMVYVMLFGAETLAASKEVNHHLLL